MKKHAGLLAPTEKGVSEDLSTWLSVKELNLKATQYLKDSVSPDLSSEVDRIDIRPDKGIVKFHYKDP